VKLFVGIAFCDKQPHLFHSVFVIFQKAIHLSWNHSHGHLKCHHCMRARWAWMWE